MEKAYISLITNESYLKGVLTLAESVKKTKTNIPFYVLVPEDISEAVLEKLSRNCIEYIKFDNSSTEQVETNHYWKDTIAKLTAFNLTQFDKIVFLDADAILFRNIDHLFDKPHLSAVAAGKELHPDWVNMNSGIMVIEPDATCYKDLVSLVPHAHKECIEKNLPFGDQDVISKYYPDWYKNEELHLPSEYNVLLGYGGILEKSNAIRGFSDVYFYHFTGKQKPWGTFADRVIILLKILRRSTKWSVDFKAYREYLKMLKNCDISD